MLGPLSQVRDKLFEKVGKSPDAKDKKKKKRRKSSRGGKAMDDNQSCVGVMTDTQTNITNNLKFKGQFDE